MRVLHVAECTGGVDRYLRCLLKYSKCENIMILSQLYKKDDYMSLASQVEIMHMSHGIGLVAIKESVELRKKIKKYNPDVVYAHSSIAGAIARIACFGLKTKIIYNPHGWSFNMDTTKKRFFVLIERFLSHFCDAIVCISEAERLSAIKENICYKDKLYVIENGIDIENKCVGNIDLPFKKDAFIVGMVGRICKQKAPEIFLKMAGEVNHNIKNVCFVIVGDVLEGQAEERIYIENLAKELGVPLFISGWVDEPMSYINKFDIGCLLSRWEGFGLVIPEYMLLGKPIVATNVDAIPYLIEDGVNGYLVEKDAWKEAADKVIALAHDENKRNEMKRNNEKAVERFSARRLAKECEELYERVVKC